MLRTVQDIGIVTSRAPQVYRPEGSRVVYLTFEGLRESRTIADKGTPYLCPAPDGGHRGECRCARSAALTAEQRDGAGRSRLTASTWGVAVMLSAGAGGSPILHAAGCQWPVGYWLAAWPAPGDDRHRQLKAGASVGRRDGVLW